jgi:hypothetical protein
MAFSFDDATGTVFLMIRHWGTIALMDCNTAAVNSMAEYLAPDGTPLMCVPGKVTLKRVDIQEPCQASQ